MVRTPLYAVPEVDKELQLFEERLQRRIEGMPREGGVVTRQKLPSHGIVAGISLFAQGNYFTIVDDDQKIYRFDRREVEFSDGEIDDDTLNRTAFVTVALQGAASTRVFLPASDTLDAAIVETEARLHCEHTGVPFVLRGRPDSAMTGQFIARHESDVAFHGPDGIYIGHGDEATISDRADGSIYYQPRSATASQTQNPPRSRL